MIKDGKKVKAVMEKLRIDEISAVDRPAQAGARAVITKRDDEAETEVEAEASFEKKAALTSAVDGHTHLVPMSGYDGEKSSGTTSYEAGHSHPWCMDENGNCAIGEMAGHTHDVAVIGKRDFSSKQRAKAADSGAAMEGGGYPIENAKDLENAIQAFGRAKDKTATAKHIAARAKALGLTDKLPTAGALAAAMGKQDDSASNADAGDTGSGDAMAVDTKTASAEDRAKSAETKLAEVEKRLVRFEKMANLSDAEKSFSKSLSEADVETFLTLEPAVRADKIAKAQAADAVVYKALNGKEFKKSDNPDIIEMAKRSDDIEKKYLASEQRIRDAAFAKRAAEEMAHLPGDEPLKVAVLKSLDAINDEGMKQKANELIKAADAAMAPAFASFGKARGTMLTGTAEQKLDVMAKRYVEEHKDVRYAEAYQKVCDSPDGQKLYEQYLDENSHNSRATG